MTEKRCPRCGKPSKVGMKYCIYCGASLEKKDDLSTEQKVEPLDFKSTQTTVEEPLVEEEIPEDIKTQLELRTKLEEIIGETSTLSGEIDKLMEGLSGDISIEEYKNEIKTLKNRVLELKREREEVEKLIKPLPLEQLARNKEELRERLEKLKGVYKSKEISTETFEKLRKEYESEFDEIRRKHRREKDKVENWIAKLEKDRKKIQEQIELLYARYKTGELTDKEYQKEKEDLKKQFNRTQSNLENLRMEIRQWG